MKKWFVLAMTVIMVTAFAPSVFCMEENIGPEEGDFSIQPSLQYTKDDDADSTTATLITSFDYYFTPAFSLGGALMLMELDAGDFDTTIMSISAFPAYHFFIPNAPRFVPYVGAGLGLSYFDADDSEMGYTYSLVLGMDYYFAESVSLNAAIGQYESKFDDYDSSQQMLTIGARILFK